MENTSFLEVVHCYDVDGGYGNSVPKERVIFRTTDIIEAQEIAQKYARYKNAESKKNGLVSSGRTYGNPYSYLEYGRIEIREVSFGLEEGTDEWFKELDRKAEKCEKKLKYEKTVKNRWRKQNPSQCSVAWAGW